MPFDITQFLGKDIGIAAALISVVFVFLHHIRIISKDSREHVKNICDNFADRTKELSEASEKRHEAANTAHEKIVSFIVDGSKEAHDRNTQLMSAKLEEVAEAVKKSHTLLEAQIRRD